MALFFIARATTNGNCIVTSSPARLCRYLSPAPNESESVISAQSPCKDMIRSLSDYAQCFSANAIRIPKYAKLSMISRREPSTCGMRFRKATILEAVKRDIGSCRRETLPLPEPLERCDSAPPFDLEGSGRRRAWRRLQAQSTEMTFKTRAAPMTPV